MQLSVGSVCWPSPLGAGGFWHRFFILFRMKHCAIVFSSIIDRTFLMALFVVLVSSCNEHAEEPKKQETVKETPTAFEATASHTATRTVKPQPVQEAPLPKPKPVKKPNGIYRAVLPFKDSKVEQTVVFYNDYTYQLQEKYNVHNKDTVTITKGNWMPSDGYIWLYKDQIALARYLWKGDTLEYFNTASKKNVSMASLKDGMLSDQWRRKQAEGTVLMGMGNEPFWSVELNAQDTLSFKLADWQQPVKVKIDSVKRFKDSTFYTAVHDSVHLKVVVFPYFCTDGSSGEVFTNRFKVEYNQRVFSGCGGTW